MSYGEIGALTHEALAQQVGRVVEAYPEALLVGSLGRACIYDRVYGDPLHEYKLRDQDPTETACGDVGDIDLIGVPPAASEDMLGPFKIDTQAFNNPSVAIIKEGVDWLVRSRGRGYEAVLDPEVFAPIEAATICGVKCKVPPAKTQLAIMSSTGAMRPKDRIAVETLSKAIEDGVLTQVDQRSLLPLYEVGAKNSTSPAARIGQAYRILLPETVRLKVSPLVTPIKEYVDLHLG